MIITAKILAVVALASAFGVAPATAAQAPVADNSSSAIISVSGASGSLAN
jgi:hypothetical protein